MRRKQARRGWDEGAAAVEAAITLSLFLLLIFGIIEFGMALYSWNTMQLAVDQAGRWAMVNNSDQNLVQDAKAQMQAVLTSAAVCTAPSAGQICVSASPPTGSSPKTMTLTAKYNFNFLALGGPFTITAQATFPLD